MDHKLDDAGLQAIWGQPLEKPKPGRGVAIIAKADVPCRKVEAKSALERELFDTGRYVHATVSVGTGHTVIHAISIYGFTGAGQHTAVMTKNERFLRDVFKVAAELGDVPVAILGDFNVELDLSHTMSAEIFCSW